MSSDSSNAYRKTSAAGYVYDNTSNAVLNTDENEYNRFIAERVRAKQESELKRRVESLEYTVRQLKLEIERLNGKATSIR